MEQIKSVMPDEFWHNNVRYDGYLVTTTKQDVRLGVSADQQCCEAYGTVVSHDDTKEFVGAELHTIKLGDSAISEVDVDLIAGQLTYINFLTSLGVLQFTFYNSNGAYGHFGVVKSDQLHLVTFLGRHSWTRIPGIH